NGAAVRGRLQMAKGRINGGDHLHALCADVFLVCLAVAAQLLAQCLQAALLERALFHRFIGEQRAAGARPLGVYRSGSVRVATDGGAERDAAIAAWSDFREEVR